MAFLRLKRSHGPSPTHPGSMSSKPRYQGDSSYSIDATNDVLPGDFVRFERARFSGTFTDAKLEGYELLQGRIIKEVSQNFILEHTDGTEIRISIWALNKNRVYRKPWTDENRRLQLSREKHGVTTKHMMAGAQKLAGAFK